MAHDTIEERVIGRKCQDLLADRREEFVGICRHLFFHIAITDLHVVVEVVVIIRSLFAAEQFAEQEEVPDDLGFLLVELGRSLIGNGPHDLLGDGFLVIAEIEAVSFGFTHLTGTIETGHFDSLVGEMEGGGFFEVLDIIDSIESTGEKTRHFHVLFLVLSYGHFVCLVHQDIGSHETGISEQTGVDVIGLFAHFLLEGSDALEFAQIGVHIEVQIEFEYLFDVRLYVYRCFLRIDATSEVFRQDGLDRIAYVFRRRVRGQRVPIGDEEHTIVFVLHLHEGLDRTKIVT